MNAFATQIDTKKERHRALQTNSAPFFYANGFLRYVAKKDGYLRIRLEKS